MISRRISVVAGLVATVVTVSVGVAAGASSAAASADAHPVAPYVDMTNNQEPMLDQAIGSAGLKAFTAAFVIGSGCTPIWGDTLPVTNDPTVSGEINRAVAAGATPIVSFGGEGGVELAQSCTDLGQVTAGYQSVIDQFHLTHLDFDVEGAAIADPDSVNRRFQAISALESANPGLVVSVTVPVLPDGLDGNGQAFLKAAKANNARVDLVNVMTMDYYGSWDTNPTMGAYATKAAAATLDFVRTLWPSDGYGNIGITPMIGQNDDAAEVFTEADAQTVVDFAKANGVGRLAFWSVDRDQPCSSTASGLPQCTQINSGTLDFTRIFGQYTG